MILCLIIALALPISGPPADCYVTAHPGDAGTVVIFHGANLTGDSDNWLTDPEKARFVTDLEFAGYCVVIPPSKAGQWSNLPATRNPDIKAVDAILASLGVASVYLVGHSNGGAFASRYAIYGRFRAAGVQFSNSAGIATGKPAYATRSLFCYSTQDPVVPFRSIQQAMKSLQSRGVTVETNDVTKAGMGHQFVNTSAATIAFFQND